MADLKGKVAVVSGASSGLGRAVSELLTGEGVSVFALGRSIEKVEFKDEVVKVVCNIRDLESIDKAFELIDDQVENIDVLVNCAGRALAKSFEETSREEIMDVLGVNLKGNMYVAQEVYKRMLKAESGHIVIVGSTSSLKAREMETVYCASKWGLRGFTESLRLEARSKGIRVAGVYPGGMKSENFWNEFPDKDISGYMDPKLVAEQIVNLLRSDEAIHPSELVIERS